MRSANSSTKAAGSRNWWAKWLGSKLMPNPSRRPIASSVPIKQCPLLAQVIGLRKRTIDFEVIAPAGQLQPVEPPARGLAGQLLEREVGPLTGEQRDGSRHRLTLTPAPLAVYRGGAYGT